MVESNISQIEHELKNAQVIKEENIDINKVSLGSKVEVKDLEFDEIEKYNIVSSVEVDPVSGKISDESPVGKALIGKKVGEIATVSLPDDGVIKYEILSIGK